jgi:Fic family protein
MTRTENIKKVNERRKETSKDRIIMLLESKKADEFKKKNGKWNAIAISKFLKMSDKTVRKNLKDIEVRGAILISEFLNKD